MALLGLLLAGHHRDEIRRREEASTAGFARIAARGLLSFIVSPSELEAPLPQERIAMLDVIIDKLSDEGSTTNVHIRAIDGTVRYATDHDLIGTRRSRGASFRRAMSGQTAATHETVQVGADDTRADVLTVTIPAKVGDTAPAGVMEVFLPYDSINATISHYFRESVALIGAGLAGLWLVLLPLVLSVARRLQRQVDDNQFLALHDPLTGLPNRALLRDRVDRAVASTKRSGRYGALMLLDLDRFKEVNDTLGHHHGDTLLDLVGKRLTEGLRDADTVARLGGDEFVVLLSDIATPEDALAAAERTSELLQQPIVVDGIRLEVESSIGVAVFPDHGTSFELLLQRADIAMYVDKSTHVGPTMFSPSLDQNSAARLMLLGDLRSAIADDELVLHFQPKLDLRTGNVAGVEALLRWDHPEHGLVPPGEFIPLAERTGLIWPLTSWVLEAATRQARCWADAGVPIPVAVNVSARSLLDQAFPVFIAELLESCGLPAELLEIEITETAIMADPVRALEVIGALAGLGLRLSIDDFGVGYTSMAHLKRLPVHELKIDRSFIASMDHDGADAVIVKSTVDLARNLGLRVVAEGVETGAVSEQLRAIGCDLAQGFHFARPMPAGPVTEWLHAHQPEAALAPQM